MLTNPLWWMTHFLGGVYGFSTLRAVQLMECGLWQIQHIWDVDTWDFIRWEQACHQFGLRQNELQPFLHLTQSIPSSWLFLLRDNYTVTWSKEFIGVFYHKDDALPLVVFPTVPSFRPRLAPGHQLIELPSGHKSFTVGTASMSLLPRSPRLNYDPSDEQLLSGWLKRIRVIPKRKGSPLYVGFVNELFFDPGRWS